MGIIIRQSIKGTVVNYIGSFIGFIMTFFIMMRFLTAEELGLTRVLLDAALLFAGLAQMGTNSSIIRFYPHFKNEKKRDHGFFFWTLLIPFIGFFIVLFFFFVFKEPIGRYFSKEAQLFVDYYNYVIPLAFFIMYIAVFECNSNVLMRIVIPKFIREVAIRLCLIVVYLLYGFKILTLNQFVVFFCVVYGIALLLNIIYLFSLQRVSLKPDINFINKPLRRDMSNYTFFMVVVVLSSTITPMLNSFFISAKLGLAFTGIFTVATYIATVVEIPYRSLGAITQPHISRAVKEKKFSEADVLCKSVSLHQLLIGSFVFYFIWINIDVIFQILPKGDFYSAGKWAVFFIAFSRLFNSVFSVGATVLSYSKYYYYSLFFTIGLTAMAILLNLWWIPVWGINGATLATVVSFIVYYLALLLFVYIKLKISPFSLNQLKIVALLGGLFLLNYLWCNTITHLGNSLNINELAFTVIDRLLCSAVMLVIGVIAVYQLKFSAEVNQLADRCIKRFFGIGI